MMIGRPSASQNVNSWIIATMKAPYGPPPHVPELPGIHLVRRPRVPLLWGGTAASGAPYHFRLSGRRDDSRACIHHVYPPADQCRNLGDLSDDQQAKRQCWRT